MLYVSQIVIDKGIKTRTELLALANARKKEGKTDLAEFITNRGNKAVDEAITIGCDIEEAPTKLERTKKIRMEILSSLKMMWTAEIQMKWRFDHRSYNRNLSNCEFKPEKNFLGLQRDSNPWPNTRGHGFESRWSPKIFFFRALQSIGWRMHWRMPQPVAIYGTRYIAAKYYHKKRILRSRSISSCKRAWQE